MSSRSRCGAIVRLLVLLSSVVLSGAVDFDGIAAEHAATHTGYSKLGSLNKAWADQWRANHPDDKRMHILFEAQGKTELSSAFNLMKALALDSENYRVTYLSPGGSWVLRNETALILKPGDEKNEGDVLRYENALPPEETDKLISAGVNVVFKSMFTKEETWFDHYIGVGRHGKGKRYGDDAWVDTVVDDWLGANLPPVDYVVVDGSAKGIHGAARFLVQVAGVPGAIWCGNVEVTFQSTAFHKLLKPAAEAFANGSARNMFTAIFVAHFLGWSHVAHHDANTVKIEDLIHVIKHPGTTLPEPPSSGDFVKRLEVALDEEKANGENDKLNLGRFKKVVLATAKAKPKPKGVADQNIVKAWPWVLAVWERCAAKVLGPTRTLDLDLQSGLIPVSLVSTVSENPGHELLRKAKGTLDQIFVVMLCTGASKLIYIAFGSQGSRSLSGESYQKIIDRASAVKDAVVLFVLPRNAPDEWLKLTTNNQEPTVVACGERKRRSLPDNVILSVWAPQREIFATFAPISESELGIQTVFWTHAGAGSLSDAVANGVPVALFPLVDDQIKNRQIALETGLGVDLRPFADDIGVPHLKIENETPKQGSTITERLEYLFDNYGWYKEKLLEARNGLKLETLTPEALIENFKQTVTKRSLVQLQ